MTYKLMTMTIKVNVNFIKTTPKKSDELTNFIMAGGASG